jgi:flavin-dependent dehydrogenase
MIDSSVIVVGGGPAGAACARTLNLSLNRTGLKTLVLDKKRFPRPKVCAGWVGPGLFHSLKINPKTYPHSLGQFNRIIFHVKGMRIPVKTRQYAIFRKEFDQWMLEQARVPVQTHTVKKIERQGRDYIIDQTYRCQYLVGAGGTHCPVFKTFFEQTEKRPAAALVNAVEAEYPCQVSDANCHIWYFEHDLPGYAWYLPKADGRLNIGIGGKALKLKQQNRTIMALWHIFVQRLLDLALIPGEPPLPRGHIYYLAHKPQSFRKNNAFAIGDAAGLSTLDMGEGIHNAVKSGIMAAHVIAGTKGAGPPGLTRFSLPGLVKFF